MNRFTLPASTSGRSVVRVGGALLTASAVLSLAACGGSGGASASETDTVTIALDADAAPNGYDPLLYSQGQFEFFSAMYDALFVTQPDGTVQGDLVANSSNSPDNLQTTLTLEDGVTFTDGKPLDSAVVKANLDRRSDPDLEAYGSLAPGQASEITDVSAPDPKTVVITWKAPQATPQNNLVDTAGVIVGPDGLADPTSLETTPDGSGAYTLNTDETTRASTYSLEKSDDARDPEDWAYDTIVFKVITDDQARANAVVSGQADVAGILDPTTIDLVESRQKTVSQGGTTVGFYFLDKTGATNPAFASEQARLAIGYAIDREKLVTDLHEGSRATAQFFPQDAAGFDPALDEEYGYDPAKAKQLLAEAGLPNGFEFNTTVLGQPTEDQVAVQSQLAAVGITMNFVTATSTDQVFASVQTDPVLFAPFAPGAQPAGFVAGVLYGGFLNTHGAKEPEIEAALGGALGATGDAQQQALTDLNTALTANAWVAPAYEDFTYFGYNADKVAEPSFAGTNNYLVLSAIKPAS